MTSTLPPPGTPTAADVYLVGNNLVGLPTEHVDTLTLHLLKDDWSPLLADGQFTGR